MSGLITNAYITKELGLKELIGEHGMKIFIISALILFTLACSCQSLQSVNISRESGMAIIANLSSNSVNQSDTSSNITQNQTNQTHTNISTDDAATGLWNWGKIPMGYELNKNGSLTKLADQEWKPSI
jgi:hypothetical protein